MKRTPQLVVLAVLILAAAGYGTQLVRAYIAYGRAINEGPAPLLVNEPSERLVSFLRQTDSNPDQWIRNGGSDYGFSDLVTGLRLRPGIDGLIDFYSSKLPPFSIIDSDRNVASAQLAILRKGLMPKSDDGFLHVSRDLGIVAIFRGDIVSVDRLVPGQIHQETILRKK